MHSPAMGMCPPTSFHRLDQVKGFRVSGGPTRQKLRRPRLQLAVARCCALRARRSRSSGAACRYQILEWRQARPLRPPRQ